MEHVAEPKCFLIVLTGTIGDGPEVIGFATMP